MKRFKKIFWLGCLVSCHTLAAEVDADAIVAAHNTWRAKVGVGALSYSHELAAAAQKWANELKQNNQCQMRHSKSDGSYGENIFWASALQWSDGSREVMQVSAAKPVDSWGSESADYNYSANTCKPGKVCGHYTQLVWKKTGKVGCAIAVCDDSKDQVWVCQYQPAGNWVGQKPY